MDVVTRETIATLEGHTDSVTSVSFSPNGALLASGSYDETIKLWNIVESRNCRHTLEGHTDYVTFRRHFHPMVHAARFRIR